jgi:hypothetical protein
MRKQKLIVILQNFLKNIDSLIPYKIIANFYLLFGIFFLTIATHQPVLLEKVRCFYMFMALSTARYGLSSLWVVEDLRSPESVFFNLPRNRFLDFIIIEILIIIIFKVNEFLFFYL